MRTREYDCPYHGPFSVELTDAEWFADDVFERPCPDCGIVCGFYWPRVSGLPAIQGDVPYRYYSENLNAVVGSKREIRELQKREGVYPLTGRDRKTAVENAHNLAAQARSDARQVERDQAAGLIRAARWEKGDLPGDTMAINAE